MHLEWPNSYALVRGYKRTVPLPGLLVFIALLGASPFSSACVDPAPETEFEKIYCQIKAKGRGDDLPEYQEFRRNPTQTQALLLRRPARKLGIQLPDSNSNKPSSLASTPVIQSQEPEIDVAAPTRPAAPPAAKKPVATSHSLDACALDQEVITCGTQQYELQINRSNKHLPADALGPGNQLVLPSRQSAAFAGASDHYYLSQTYVNYIEKMIDIGLADATMSFTKYVATWEDIKSNNGDFSLRFAQMYELLKQERQTNAVKSRYNNNFPESIKQCMGLSSTLIVCDNVMQNWIYRSR